MWPAGSKQTLRLTRWPRSLEFHGNFYGTARPESGRSHMSLNGYILLRNGRFRNGRFRSRTVIVAELQSSVCTLMLYILSKS